MKFKWPLPIHSNSGENHTTHRVADMKTCITLWVYVGQIAEYLTQKLYRYTKFTFCWFWYTSKSTLMCTNCDAVPNLPNSVQLFLQRHAVNGDWNFEAFSTVMGTETVPWCGSIWMTLAVPFCGRKYIQPKRRCVNFSANVQESVTTS